MCFLCLLWRNTKEVRKVTFIAGFGSRSDPLELSLLHQKEMDSAKVILCVSSRVARSRFVAAADAGWRYVDCSDRNAGWVVGALGVRVAPGGAQTSRRRLSTRRVCDAGRRSPNWSLLGSRRL